MFFEIVLFSFKIANTEVAQGLVQQCPISQRLNVSSDWRKFVMRNARGCMAVARDANIYAKVHANV